MRQESLQKTRLLDGRALDLNNLSKEITSRETEAAYLSTLLGDYLRNFESKLHIAELQRYEKELETAKLAPENGNLSDEEIFLAQSAVLDLSLERLESAAGGASFPGSAVATGGIVRRGRFLVVGPAALFRSDDGAEVGTAEQKLGSLEPTLVSFADPLTAAAASSLVETGQGVFPLDPSLGNAHKIAATEESLIEHIKKGGAVMVPIFVMAGAALLVALYKFLALLFVRKPSKKRLTALFSAIEAHDKDAAHHEVTNIRGPVGRMLAAGVEHIDEPRELIEEVMYEKMLTSRLKLMRMLPFISICAASAPLLGLLGTVTGIITTFKMITVFGSGDVKTLSGGISEALITTEFGLIVAIPSLLLHAFLTRMARGMVNRMETAAVAFLNHVQTSPFGRAAATERAATTVPSGASSDPRIVKTQVKQALGDLLSPLVSKDLDREDELTGSRA